MAERMTDREIRLLATMCNDVRMEVLNVVAVALSQRYSPVAVRRIVKDVVDNLSPMDESAIRAIIEEGDSA